ncbi:MAG: non-canonical purine NTP pyrophosphatase [Eubacteriales bacterium]|nr:non-canonical purine NTP pyrophosphatase [Eubacteriales bacterium]
MELIYGTGNEAKLQSMRRTLTGMDIRIVGMKELLSALPDVPETGGRPLENARQKAHAYYALLKRPVFSVDSGLYIDGIDAALQPGVHVRNVNGKCLTDDEMVAHYAALARSAGGRALARYRNGICLVMDADHIYERCDGSIAGHEFLLCDTPHARREPGFPLDSLSRELHSCAYFYDLPSVKKHNGREEDLDQGTRRFFADALDAYRRTSLRVGATRG